MQIKVSLMLERCVMCWGTGITPLITLRVRVAKLACSNTFFSTCSVLVIFHESGTTGMCDDRCAELQAPCQRYPNARSPM